MYVVVQTSFRQGNLYARIIHTRPARWRWQWFRTEIIARHVSSGNAVSRKTIYKHRPSEHDYYLSVIDQSLTSPSTSWRCPSDTTRKCEVGFSRTKNENILPQEMTTSNTHRCYDIQNKDVRIHLFFKSNFTLICTHTTEKSNLKIYSPKTRETHQWKTLT
mgnify:CR=1 FL=1